MQKNMAVFYLCHSKIPVRFLFWLTKEMLLIHGDWATEGAGSESLGSIRWWVQFSMRLKEPAAHAEVRNCGRYASGSGTSITETGTESAFLVATGLRWFFLNYKWSKFWRWKNNEVSAHIWFWSGKTASKQPLYVTVEGWFFCCCCKETF